MDPVTIANWIALGNLVLPRVLSVVQHYEELQNNDALNETDKQKMKENLEGLRLPDWDTI